MSHPLTQLNDCNVHCLHAQVQYLGPYYQKITERYQYVKGPDGSLPPWPVDWVTKKLKPLINGTKYWAGDATQSSIMFTFTLNKDGSIPKNCITQLEAAIVRLEGRIPIDARVDSGDEGDEDQADL